MDDMERKYLLILITELRDKIKDLEARLEHYSDKYGGFI